MEVIKNLNSLNAINRIIKMFFDDKIYLNFDTRFKYINDVIENGEKNIYALASINLAKLKYKNKTVYIKFFSGCLNPYLILI